MAISHEVVFKIINSIVNEDLKLREAIKIHGSDPAEFFNYIWNDTDLTNQYTRAQHIRAEKFAEEIIEISDTETDTQRARNRIDTRRWFASKMNPRQYGDRVDVNVTQTVSITSALEEAKKRIQLPKLQDNTNIIDGELVTPTKLPELDIFK